eukprot:34340_1
MAIVEKRCPLLLCPLDSESTPKIEDLLSALEKGSDEERIGALKKIIHCMISGIDMSRLTMQIIKFCLRSKSHEIKKLLQIYWEVLDKKDVSSGKLKPEMILVCNHLLNDLKHSNEYIRGSTLRLLCRIDEAEILEQLVPQIVQNLEHRHSYVRKNAVLAVLSIIRDHGHSHLIPDASERIYSFLETETNNLCRRNAFLMLTACDLRNSLKFFLSIEEDDLINYPESMQITVLELMRKVCRSLPVPKSIFVQCAAKLLESQSNGVVYEAANTLLSLTPLDSAVNKALESYTRLLQTESDQNVKLIVINRLNSLRIRYQRNLRLIIMDILRGLSTPNIDLRRNILSLILSLASANNIADIIQCLKKEMISISNTLTLSIESDLASSLHNIEYRNLLVETIHECAVRFPIVASSVVHLLMNYLGDDDPHHLAHPMQQQMHAPIDDTTKDDDKQHAKDESTKDDDKQQHTKTQSQSNHSQNKSADSPAYDVILFVKEIVEEYPDLTDSILSKLLQSFNEIRSEAVYRCCLWIFGEYATSREIIVDVIDKICESIGELPLMSKIEKEVVIEKESSKAELAAAAAENKYLTRTVVLPDGTYAQSTMAMAHHHELTAESAGAEVKDEYYLRKLIKNGEYFLGSVLSLCLLKLMLRYKQMDDCVCRDMNKLTAKCLLIVTSIIRYGQANKQQMDNDSKDRMLYVVNKLLLMNGGNLSPIETEVLLTQCRRNFGAMLLAKRSELRAKQSAKEAAEKNVGSAVPFDRMLSLRQLSVGLEFRQFDESDSLNLQKAVGNMRLLSDTALRTRLSRIHQLTGFSDPIYAEAAVTVHQFDIILDFLIINNTPSTLQNLCLELHTSGDLKIVEKPQKMTLAPKQSQRIEASIKVSSTENGVIFGNIVYDTTGATSDKNIVVMNCIHMDIMDYVHPEFCSQSKFRKMWVQFEWENKVPVNTDITNLNSYIQHIANITNMQLLTANNQITKCQFLAANLHAKSIFGEHALMNVSIELKHDEHETKISGHIRIRCKSQGIALSLGEKITNGQRSNR